MSTKHIIIAILFLTSTAYYYHLTDPTPPAITAQVTRIIDGDTLETNNIAKIRLLGINTPERAQPYYQEAKQYLIDIAANKTIQIESTGQDKYSRTLAHIFINDQNINAQILTQGLATLYYYDHDQYYDELKKAEEFARTNQLGLWKPSPNAHCIKITEFKTDEPEHLHLQNICNYKIDLTYKDDATHIYKATIPATSQYKNNFSHIWNTDGDSIYIYDDKGLLSFYRY